MVHEIEPSVKVKIIFEQFNHKRDGVLSGLIWDGVVRRFVMDSSIIFLQ